MRDHFSEGLGQIASTRKTPLRDGPASGGCQSTLALVGYGK